MEFFLCNKREIAVKRTIHYNSAVSKALKAQLLKQYVLSLKKVVCIDRANRNGMP